MKNRMSYVSLVAKLIIESVMEAFADSEGVEVKVSRFKGFYQIKAAVYSYHPNVESVKCSIKILEDDLKSEDHALSYGSQCAMEFVLKIQEKLAGEADCGHLEEGGTWENCPYGGENQELIDECLGHLDPPEEDGAYLVWDGVPNDSECLGVVRRKGDHLLGLHVHRNPSIMCWKPVWVWTKIKERHNE